MHRSRPFVLVVLAAAAACSKRDPAEGNDILSQDRTLAARLETTAKDSRHPTVPDACGAITLAPAPSAADQQQAEALTQQAGVAELHGNIREAKSLLRRASELDGTNKSAAYHLGRTSEALGDNGTALTAYCRYLALAPTAAESLEARQRVAGLARSMPRATSSAASNAVVPGAIANPTPTRPARERASIDPRAVASAAMQRSAPTRSPARVPPSPNVVSSGSAQPQSVEPQSSSATTPADDTHGSTTAAGDVVARAPMPAPDPAPAPPRAQRRGSIGAQSAIIGVATGAIIGAATGRSVRSTVIGAAAGGVLGTVVGATTRPMGRNTRS